jgi:atypical dual specificity phosphatase
MAPEAKLRRSSLLRSNKPVGSRRERDHESPFQSERERFVAYEPRSSSVWNATAFSLPRFLGSSCKTVLGVTVVLYILNQKALLPQPVSAVVSRVLFWPTLPITALRRLWVGSWTTVIDDTVVMGGAPFGFLGWPERLYHEYGIRGVVNMCEEYTGPVDQYKALGMDYLRLPTYDHFIPSVQHLHQAVEFLKKHHEEGKKVYVHCRAGHGRSAAAVFAWMLYQDPSANRQELNRQFCKLRNVKSTLWKQPNIVEFHRRLLDGPGICK